MHRLCLPLLLLLFLCTSVSAQETQDLRQDTVYFQQQAQLYQRWLDDAGFGAYLKVRELEVKEKSLAIYLEFKSDDIDWVATAWMKMKESFEAKNQVTLEQQLFYKAEAMMEVRQSALSVQIYDTYDLRNAPLFERAIYFEDGEVKTQTSDPKSKTDFVELAPSNIDGGDHVAIQEFHKKFSRKKVHACILKYVTERFEQDVCEDRNPRVDTLEDDKVLRFRVYDLCKEVLQEESSLICGWLRGLGYDCEWAKRELLTFTITHIETLSGIRIQVELDGKIGSGFYANVRRGGYLSMEIDRDQELDEYANSFASDLRKMLESCQ